MNVKELIDKRLKRYKTTKSYVEATKSRISMYEEIIKNDDYDDWCIGSRSSDELGVAVQSKSRGSIVESTVIGRQLEKDDALMMIRQDRSRMFWKKLEVEQIETAIKALTEWEKYIFECKYCENKFWVEIEIGFNKQYPQKNNLTDERLRQMFKEGMVKINEVLTPFYEQHYIIYNQYEEQEVLNKCNKTKIKNGHMTKSKAS